MSFRLPRLSKKYLEVPQYITQTALEDIAEVIDSKDRSVYREAFKAVLASGDTVKNNATLSIFGEEARVNKDDEDEYEKAYGVLSVEGTLTCKTTGWEALCGGGSYETLVSDMKRYASEGLKTVYMIVDSGGGEAYRCISTSRELRKIADDNGINLVGYVDGCACSAAYALLTACHETILNPDGSAGSIGAVSTLINDTGALEKKGYKRHFISAGKSKIPFDKETGEFKSEFLEERQKSINNSYDKFVKLVNEQRPNLSLEAIYDTEAKVFIAEEALSLGLVDKLMEVSEFQDEYLSGETGSDNERKKSPSTQNFNTLTTPKENLMSDNIDMEAFEAMKAKLEAFEAKDAQASLDTKKATLTESLKGTTFLSDVEGVVSFLMNADDTQSTMLNTVLTDAGKQLTQLTTEHTKAVTTLTAEHDVTVLALKDQVTAAELAKETVKEEFAAPAAIRATEVEPVNNREEAISAQIAKDKNRK